VRKKEKKKEDASFVFLKKKNRMFALERCGVEELNSSGGVAGLSAGAMVLAPSFVDEKGELQRGFGRLKCNILISVHEEASGWEDAKKQFEKFKIPVLCIPTGGAAVICGRFLKPVLRDGLLMECEPRELKADVWVLLQ
jgi:hypothetical protein